MAPSPLKELPKSACTLPKGLKKLPELGKFCSKPKKLSMPAEIDEFLPVLVVALLVAFEDSTIWMVTMSPILLAVGSINNSLSEPLSCQRDPSCFIDGKRPHKGYPLLLVSLP